MTAPAPTVCIVAVLAAVAGAGAVKAPAVERRLERSSQRRTAALAAIAAVAAFALGGILAAGGPSAVAARAADSFRSTPSANVATSDKRLLTLSDQGRLEYWRVAWRAYTSEPLRGTGAGTYELAWHRERTTYYDVRDAHNLYLEQLSETGPLGLALLVGALAAPFAGARATRRRPLGPAVLAAYSAILLHAVVDWDWEMPAVVAAGIACGVAAISLARSPRRALAPTTRALAAAALGVLAVAALGVQIANTAQSHAYAALHEGRFAAAEADAGRALRFAPWTSEPLRVRGEAELAQHRSAAAAEAFRTAIRQDPRDWHLWFDLATVSSDGERAAALKRALRLDPLEPALLDFAGALRAARLGPIIQR